MPMDTPKDVDEYTPRERGLMIGYDLGRRVARGEVEIVGEGDAGTVLAKLAALGVPDALRAELAPHMRGRLDASEDPDAEEAFWIGVRHGVRAYVTATELGGGEN